MFVLTRYSIQGETKQNLVICFLSYMFFYEKTDRLWLSFKIIFVGEWKLTYEDCSSFYIGQRRFLVDPRL
jgi:hypothetical protein